MAQGDPRQNESQYRRSLNENTRRDRGDANENEATPDTEGLEQLDRTQDEGDTGGYTNILPDEKVRPRKRPGRTGGKERPSGPSGSEEEYERASREDFQRQQEDADADRERQNEMSAVDQQRQQGATQNGKPEDSGGWGWQTGAGGKQYWVKTPERDRERRLFDKNASAVEKARYYREEVGRSLALWKNRLSADYWKNRMAQAVKNRVKSFLINILWNNPWVRGATLAVLGAVLGILAIWFVSILATAAVCTWTEEHDIPVVTPIVRQYIEWQTQIKCPKGPAAPATTDVTGTTGTIQ